MEPKDHDASNLASEEADRPAWAMPSSARVSGMVRTVGTLALVVGVGLVVSGTVWALIHLLAST